jgi:coniferyl-aldehyde dehydrogenase
MRFNLCRSRHFTRGWSMQPITPQEEALAAAFAALQAAYRADPHPDWQTRERWLRRLAEMLRAQQSALAEAVSLDFGQRSLVETRLAELFPALAGIRHARKHLKRWMKPEKRHTSIWFRPANNYVLPQPLGVVGVVVPWNYPLYLALGPLIAALAAGNRVLIKMSELSPHTGALLGPLLEQALGSDVVRVFNGPVELAQHFSRLPFDHLLFTGSTAVGHKVMAAAAEHLTPVTLELGGKSPVIIAADADLARAARAIVGGKMLNAGQTCVAPDYVLLPRGQRAALVSALTREATRAYPELTDNPDLTSIINAQHYQRLQDWCAEARAAGATLQAVNPRGEDPSAVRKLPLTLVWDCPESCTLMQQEIFGPILPLIEVDDLAAAIDYVNRRPRPLALYLMSEDAAVIEQVLQQTVSGGVALNETVMHVAQDDLPFGGVGASGMGHYHAHEGFLTFSKLKPVFRQHRINGRWLLLPPYGWLARGLLRLMMGR